MKKILLFTLLAIVLLAGCSLVDTATSPPMEATVENTPENIGEEIPDESTSQPPVSNVEQEATPPTINLPVVGVGNPTPTTESQEVGSGQNPPEQGELDPESGSGVLVEAEILIGSLEVEVERSGDLPEVFLVVTGSLPTPCHQFAFQPEQPDNEGRINVRIFSLYDNQEECVQMLQPFNQKISLGLFPAGNYTILVNGEAVRELEL